MKKVSLTDIKNARKWALPAGIIALGFASVAVGQPGTNGSKAAVTEVSSTNSQAQGSESPAPTVKPKITVNGQDIPTDKDGSTSVAIPGGTANVDISDGRTRITTDESGEGNASNTQSSNVDVNINSQSTGKSSGSTHINGFSTSSGNSSRSRTTTSFSTDINNHTSVSH